MDGPKSKEKEHSKGKYYKIWGFLWNLKMVNVKNQGAKR